jgi:hypothetical protein
MPSGGTTAAAAALRWYPGPMETHRIFADLSWTLVGVAGIPGAGSPTRWYRPGVMIGYSYLAPSGFSVTAGAGLAAPVDEGMVPLAQVAFGWTWRR